MKRNILYRICGTLFSLSALAACGLEPQEECLPCNGKLRYTEVHMEGAPSAAGFATPLYVFRGRRERRTDTSSTAVTLPVARRRNAQWLPLTELRSSDYRFLMIAQPDGGEWLTLNTAAGTTLVTGAAWEDLRLECAAGAAGAGRVRRLYRPERRSHSARRKHPSHADAYRRTGAFRHLPYGRLAVTARKHRFARHGVGDRPGIPDRNHL